jgi:cytoskeletal protein CcmA (bactofilin family)
MEIPTLINSGSRIKGELMFTTDVRIDGEVLGKVESDRNAIIGAEGYVKGFLRARDLVVFGRLEGNIVVSGTTTLHAGSSIFGNLYTKGIEINEGAIITARVITYEKLGAFDEAQINLAEEMMRMQPGRRNIPIYQSNKLSFEDNVTVSDDNQCFPFMNQEKTVLDQIVENKDVVVSSIVDSVINNTKIVEEEIAIELNTDSPADSSSEFSSDLSVSPSEPEKNITLDEIQSDFGNELHISITAPETPLEEQYLIHVTPVIDLEQISVPEVKTEILVNTTSQTAGTEDELFIPIQKSISIASSLGLPVKEDYLILRKKRAYKPDATIPPQSARKGKGSTILGFEELRNLLSHAQYPDVKPGEKKKNQVRYNMPKLIDNEMNNLVKVQEKGEFSLNDAISQLPVNDYLSLFQ